MLEFTFAALGAGICLALLVRMALPAHWRWRVDAACQRLGVRLRGLFTRRSGAPRAVRQARQSGLSGLSGGSGPWHPPRTTRRPGPARPPAPNPVDAAEAQRAAEREAREVIDRVRQQARGKPDVQRDGNVYRPDTFKPRPPEDKLH